MNFYKNEIPPDYKHSLWLILLIAGAIAIVGSIIIVALHFFDIGFFEAF